MTAPTPKADVSIRVATLADHGGISTVLQSGYATLATTSPSYFAHVTDPSRWLADATAAFVATLPLGADDAPTGAPTEEVVGVVAFAVIGSPLDEGFDPPLGDANFRFLAVAPAVHGQGVARALVTACMQAGRERGCRRLAIFTMASMTTAQHLYDSMGFVRRPDRDVRFPGGPGLAYTYDLVADAAAHFAPPGPIPTTPPWYEDVLVN